MGPGVSPKMALSVGLKVDAEALPADLVPPIKAGKVNMDDPASTVALLKANAVVGVTAFLNPDGSAKSVGITMRPLSLDGGRFVRARASAAGSTAGRTAT